jgi:hypothetical protein
MYLASSAAMVVAAGLACASTPPPGDKPAPATPGEPASLAGPRIGAKHDEKTLVQRDFDGRLKRLEGHPVYAALDMMDLSKDERAAAMKPLMQRSLAIEKIMRDNTRLVLEAQAAFKPGDDGRGQQAVVKLYELAQPVFAGGKLIDLAAAQLPPEKARELRQLVGEYMQAAVADRMAGNVDGKKQERLGAFLGESGALFGKEVEIAAKRTFEGGEKEFKELSRKLDLTPEQESKMQALFINMMTKGYQKPSKGDQMKVLLSAYSLLTDEQRAKLREMMAQEARDAAKAKQQMRQTGKGGK